MTQPDCQIAALCDVYEPYLNRDYNAVNPRYIKDMNDEISKMGEKFPNELLFGHYNETFFRWKDQLVQFNRTLFFLVTLDCRN